MQVEIFFFMETIRDPTFSCLVVPMAHKYWKIFLFVPGRQVRGARPKVSYSLLSISHWMVYGHMITQGNLNSEILGNVV